MSTLLDLETVAVIESDPVLQFEDHRPVKGLGISRFLRLHGRRAYYLGPGCDTCGLIFEKQDGADSAISPAEISARLRDGLRGLDDELLEAAGRVLPSGTYRAALLEISPELVSPGGARDYFANEQVELFGIDPYTGSPSNPGTDYYRGRTLLMGEDRALFEFLVPLLPVDRLDEERVSLFAEQLRQGARPTAFALGLVEVQGPAVLIVEGNPEITEHWSMTHFLLDGHHKVRAAAESGQPLTLLSLIATDQGTATREQVERALEELGSEAATV